MFLLLIAGGLLAAGCGGSESGSASGGPSSSEPSSIPASSETSTPPLASGVPSPSSSVQLPPPPSGDPSAAANVPPNLLSQILDDAAKRTGMAANQMQVTSVQAQTWSDGSLGCPEPGMNYIQIMIDGFQIFVQAGERTLDYRTSDRGAFKLCEKQ
jgi:hypothetical protein